jgi:hypothetical protein
VESRFDYFLFADNPLGGFLHGCFQGENVYDALNIAMPDQRKRGIMCLNVE